jgi:Coenzyme PQQ synthesis protein D (PqqD)
MPEPVIHRSKSVIWDVVNGATTLCHTEKAEFFTVNHTGAAIWDACEGRTVDQIVAEIRARYPKADEAEATTLVRGYIDLLEKEGLVERRADDAHRRRGGR